MLIKLFLTTIIYHLITGINVKDKQLFGFNVYQRDNQSNQVFGDLSIPSLDIWAKTNLTFDDSTNTYNFDFIVDKPFNFDMFGVIHTSIDTTLSAKIFDTSIKSKTYNHINTGIRTSIAKSGENNDLIVLTNMTFKDSINNIDAKYFLTFINSDICPTISLSHNLTTIPNQILYFSSNVTQICDLYDEFSSKINIDINIGSQLWPLLNAQLQQVFNFGKNSGSESMTATHPLMDISVTAKWDKSQQLIHYKKALFKSKITDFIPSFEIEFKKYKEYPNQLILNILKEVPKIDNNLDKVEL